MDKQSTLNKTFELNNTQMMNTQKELGLKEAKLQEQTQVISQQLTTLEQVQMKLKKTEEDMNKQRRKFQKELKERETIEVQNMILKRIETMITTGQTLNTGLVQASVCSKRRSYSSKLEDTKMTGGDSKAKESESLQQRVNLIGLQSGLTQYSAINPNSQQCKTMGINSYAQQYNEHNASLISGEYALTLDLRGE